MKKAASPKAPSLARLMFAALIVALPFLIIGYASFSAALERCALTLDFTSSEAAIIHVYVDRGDGHPGQDHPAVRATPSSQPQHLRFSLGKGAISKLRIAVDQPSGRFAIANMQIVPGDGSAAMPVGLNLMKPSGHVADFAIANGIAKMAADSAYPALLLALPQPFVYHPSLADRLAFWPRALAIWVICLLLVTAFLAVLRWHSRQKRDPISGKKRVDRWLPATLVVVAGVLSIYPLFLGRSLTSPQINSVPLLYSTAPYLPGGSLEPRIDGRSSDVGAYAWQWQPWTKIQAQTIKQGQPPLWDRFDYGGLPLLAQGISELGDPLHLIPLLGGSSAQSWDLQFGLMRILFALGCFCAVLRLTGAPWIAAAIGASSAFIGFFLFRINHAGNFALCYTPWLFVGWIEITRAKSAVRLIGACLLLSVVSLGCLNSGAVKEGAAALIIMHMSGLLFFVSAPLEAREKFWRLVVVGLFGAAALCIQYPIAFGFLTNLPHSRTESDAVRAETLPLSFLGNFLDDFFYFKISLQRFPSLNLALGICILWALTRFGRLRRQPGFYPILVGMGLSALLVYDFLPENVIAAMPFIGHIGHLDDTFSIPLIVLGIFLAGFGLAAFIEDVRAQDWRRPFWICAGLLGAFTTVAIISRASHLPDASDPVMPIILIGMVILAILLPFFTERFMRSPTRFLISGAAIIAILFTLHARQGLQIASGLWRIDHYLLMPGPRPDYAVPSPSMSWLRNQTARTPARAVGTQANLFPGYGSAVGIELINGPDPLVPKHVFEILEAFQVPMQWGWRVHFDDFASLHTFDALLDFLNVRWVVAAPDMTADAGNLTKRFSADLTIYERPSAWPRAFFTDRVEHYTDLTELISRIKQSNGIPFAAVPGPSTPSANDTHSPQIVHAHDYRLRPNGTDFWIDAPGPGMIVLAETCVPGIVATIDDKAQPVECVDSIYRGVRVDRAGRFHVSFDFDPPYWRQAPFAAAGAIGFLILGCIAAFLIRPRKISGQGLVEPAAAPRSN